MFCGQVVGEPQLGHCLQTRDWNFNFDLELLKRRFFCFITNDECGLWEGALDGFSPHFPKEATKTKGIAEQ